MNKVVIFILDSMTFKIAQQSFRKYQGHQYENMKYASYFKLPS